MSKQTPTERSSASITDANSSGCPPIRRGNGVPTTSVFKLVREELRVELRAVSHAAREQRETVRSRPVPLNVDGEVGQIVIRASPPGEGGVEHMRVEADDVRLEASEHELPRQLGRVPPPEGEEATLTASGEPLLGSWMRS